MKPTLHLTERFQAEAADKLISKLRQENAANEEYIAELEEGVSPKYENKIKELEAALKTKDLAYEELQEQCNKLTNDVAEIKQLYSKLNTKHEKYVSSPESYIAPYKEEIKALEKRIEELIKVRDHLIFRLNNDR